MKPQISISLLALASLFSTSGVSIPTSAAPPTVKLGFGISQQATAGEDYVPKQLVVGIKPTGSNDAVTQALIAQGAQIKDNIPGKAILAQFGSESAVNKAINNLSQNSNISFLERNGKMSLPPEPQLDITKSSNGQANISPQNRNSRPNRLTNIQISPQAISGDSSSKLQWHHAVIRKTANLGVLNPNPPTIAIIDTGVDYNHPDLAGKVILGLDTVNEDTDPIDDNGHGTHVAGIAAAISGNGLYGEGVSPKSKILAIKVLDRNGYGTFFDVAEGMAYARTVTTNPATLVINMSLGGPQSDAIAQEVAAIKASGRVLVAAAGNSDTSNTEYAYPGADSNTALRVMATEQNDCRTYFSNYSPASTPSQYNIAAPGWQIPSTLRDDGFGKLSGTSMASPVVAGAAALVWGQNPFLSRDTLVSRLVNNGRRITCGFESATRRVDVRKALFPTTSETALFGRLLDPATGLPANPNTTPFNARLLLGNTQLKVDQTDRTGFYELLGLSATTGLSLKGDRTSYVNSLLRDKIAIQGGQANGFFTDGIPQARNVGAATITLDWKGTQPVNASPGCKNSCLGSELDLYLKTPSGEYIAYYNPGDLTKAPFVKFQHDSYRDLEPVEASVINGVADNGTYAVVVANYGYYGAWNPTWNGSQASVQMYNGSDSLTPSLLKPPSTCGTSRYWHVGNLTKIGSYYSLAPVNTCSDNLP